MSKGHGKIERAILEALRGDRGHRGMFWLGTQVENLARYVRSGPAMHSVNDPDMALVRKQDGSFEYITRKPTRSEIESVRRALRNLRKQGLIPPGLRLNYTIHEGPGKKPQSPS